MSTIATPALPRASLGVIFLVLFLDLVGFSILFPLYPQMLDHYLHHHPGVLGPVMAWVDGTFPSATPLQRSALFGGLLGGVYSLLQFIAAPFWGRISDRVGRRPVLLLSLCGSVIAYVLWMVAGSFTVLLISRLLAGVVGGAAVMASAAVADSTPTPAARAKGMALVGMAFGLGFILGPVIGGLTAAQAIRIDQGGLAAWGFNPFSTPAAIAAALSLGNLLWALRSFHETLPPERRSIRGEGERTANPLKLFTATHLGATIVMLNVVVLLHTGLFSGMESTLGFLATERLAFTPRDIGYLFGLMGFIAALMQGLVFRRLAPRLGAKPLAVLGFALLAPGFALIALVDGHPGLGLLVLGIVVLAAGTGLVFPALNTLVSLAADERNQGFALGSFRSASALGRAIGPLVAAIAYFSWSPAAPYWIGAIGILVPLALVAMMTVARPPKP